MIAAVLSVLAVTAFAGEPPHDKHKMHWQKAEQRMQKMVKKLDLTDEQQQSIKAIHDEAKAKKDALDKQYNIEAYRKAKRAIGNESRTKFETVLTDEQKAKLEKMKKKKKHKKHN